MALERRGVIGRILYGLLFAAGIPLLLVRWANATEDLVRLPAYQSTWAGATLVATGVLLMAAGMSALWRLGGGLPMNAYPPPRYVRGGIYSVVAHPIYLGFVLACAGCALAAGSASGLWLVTPAAAAGCAALVVGYERRDLERRFPDAPHRPRLSLPRAADQPPGAWERVSVYVRVFLPWLVAYEAVQAMGVPPDAIVSHLPFERDWPVLQWTAVPYASVYALVLLTPLVADRARGLRRFALTGLLATATVTLVYLTVPLVAPPRPFTPTTLPGRLLAAEQSFNHTVAAFPAFHVLWALIAADAWPRRWRRAAYLWAVAIAASCVTTGMHSLADIVAAALAFPLLRSYDRIWEGLRRAAERLANSWREWRIGPLRVINHAGWAALAGALGTGIAGAAAGADHLTGVVLVAVLGLAGAGLWAQLVEGSPALSRPFGFYGSVIGGWVGALTASRLGMDGWHLLAAFAVAMPWTQAIGRLRCLVQGCCHGGPAPPSLGIRYRHPRSRVTVLSGLAAVPIHPTPLYSILGNVVAGVLVLRLWALDCAPTFVLGAYLILNNLARFVEESFRAEPQTPVVGGLHLYHWLAIGGLAAGALVMGVPSEPRAPLPPGPWLWLVASCVALLAGFAMGVDWPESQRRFSRLAASEPLRPVMSPADSAAHTGS